MNGNEQKMSRAQDNLEDINRSYGVLSRFYPVAEGVFEKGLRRKGLQLLSVTSAEIVLEVGVGTGYSLNE